MKNEINKDYLTEIFEVIARFAREDYTVQLKLSGKNDLFDSIAMGINMMVDDLREKTDREAINLRHLEKLNLELQQEIDDRRQVEVALQEAHNELETRVKERTKEL